METGVQITRETVARRGADPSFTDRLDTPDLRSIDIRTLQVNVGKLCNQACKHCHVDASPIRTEIMGRNVIDACLSVLDTHRIPILDITGGAPELIPDFRYFVTEAKKIGTEVIVRHNLTVTFELGQGDLPDFFAANRVALVSSLPYFLQRETDSQRGTGVFEKSVSALRRLNAVGYGTTEDLTLDLVYNPVGAYLPPEQSAMETDFKRELVTRYGIVFNNLFTITNMPIARFDEWLYRSGNRERYMQKLRSAFNPDTVGGLMCRDMVSVDWQGRLFDCDFNQMLGLPLERGRPQTIFKFEKDVLIGRAIATAEHCFGCTAGAGSSCGGAVVN